MRKTILKLTLIIITLFITHPLVNATEIESEKAIILQKNDGNKIVYISGKESNEFIYALSNNDSEEDLEFQSYVKDSNGKNVIYIEKDENFKNIFIKEGEKVSKFDINNVETITEEDILNVESLTKKINIDCEQQKTSNETKEDGTIVDKTQGKIVINDDGEYKYDIFEIVDNNSSCKELEQNAVNLYAELNKNSTYNNTYDKLVSELAIKNYYTLLVKNANWKSAENREIIEDENAQNDEKFLVLVGKLENGKITKTDIQIMNCTREDKAGKDYASYGETKQIENKAEEPVENEEEQVKKFALPVTGENIAIYVALGIVVIAIIVVIIRVKKLGTKENTNDK